MMLFADFKFFRRGLRLGYRSRPHWRPVKMHSREAAIRFYAVRSARAWRVQPRRPAPLLSPLRPSRGCSAHGLDLLLDSRLSSFILAPVRLVYTQNMS